MIAERVKVTVTASYILVTGIPELERGREREEHYDFFFYLNET